MGLRNCSHLFDQRRCHLFDKRRFCFNQGSRVLREFIELLDELGTPSGPIQSPLLLWHGQEIIHGLRRRGERLLQQKVWIFHKVHGLLKLLGTMLIDQTVQLIIVHVTHVCSVSRLKSCVHQSPDESLWCLHRLAEIDTLRTSIQCCGEKLTGGAEGGALGVLPLLDFLAHPRHARRGEVQQWLHGHSVQSGVVDTTIATKPRRVPS
mmetsp:Transcript_1558/g.4274  ORF Transcript_1558/g.4274 Transcript_1558/m.4274 type:complete len:207 (-) Transcript_1558:102-722(-)